MEVKFPIIEVYDNELDNQQQKGLKTRQLQNLHNKQTGPISYRTNSNCMTRYTVMTRVSFQPGTYNMNQVVYGIEQQHYHHHHNTSSDGISDGGRMIIEELSCVRRGCC